MTTVEKYQQYKTKVEQLERDKAKAEGALEHQLEQLKKDFNCADIASANKLLKKLNRESTEAAEAFDESVEAFEEKWGEVLI